jgi:hypothetical protein
MAMLGILAALVFGVAFVFNVMGRTTDRIFSVTSLLILGLILLALQMALIGSTWIRRR